MVKKGGLKLFILLASKNGNNFFFIKLRQEFCFLKRKAMEYLSEYFLSKGCVLMFCAYLSQSHKRGHSNGQKQQCIVRVSCRKPTDHSSLNNLNKHLGFTHFILQSGIILSSTPQHITYSPFEKFSDPLEFSTKKIKSESFSQ